MSAESAPNLTQESAPKPKKKKRAKAKGKKDESNVIPLSSYEEQMEDVEAFSGAPEFEDEIPRHSGVFLFERRHTSEVEQEHEEQKKGELISLFEKRDTWQKELNKLEQKDEPSAKEQKRRDALRSKVEHVALIEERAKEINEREKTEERMEEVERDFEAADERLIGIERELDKAEEERNVCAQDIRNNQWFFDVLNKGLRDDPTDAAKAEMARTSQILEEKRSEMEGRDLRIRDLRHEESAARAKVKEKNRILEAFAASLLILDKKIAELDSKIEGEPVSVEDEHPGAEAEEPAAEAEEIEEPRPSRLSRAARAIGRGTVTSAKASVPVTGVLAGGAIALGAGAVALAGRFGRTLFENLSSFIRHPIEFFGSVRSKFSSFMESPPGGKGPILGFLEGAKWMLIGDPLTKKEKKSK